MSNFTTLSSIRTAEETALAIINKGTAIIRDGYFLRVFIPVADGKISTSDQNYDASTGVLITVEEPVLTRPEGAQFNAGIMTSIGQFVELRARSFYAFVNLAEGQDVFSKAEWQFYADAGKTTEAKIPGITHEQLIAAVKNVLKGDVQKQWKVNKSKTAIIDNTVKNKK